MDALMISRLQFAITTSFHFLFAPLSIGLSLFVAVTETLYVLTKNEMYLRMTKFWGNIFLVSVVMGDVTGIVLEFQFGLNWSEFSRYVGDIFGPPLAIESWVAFFMESVFIGVWIFGWKKLSPKLHLFAIWMVAFGSLLSAFWILGANAFMQQPVGHVVRNNRVELVDFFVFLSNPHLWYLFFHAAFAAICTAMFLVIGISAYHLLKKSRDTEVYRRSLHMAALFGLVGVFGVIFVGHDMARHIVHAQPMKLATFEALWDTTDSAGETLFAIVDEKNQVNTLDIRVPYVLSILIYDKMTGTVKGIKDVQKDMVAQYGPGDYIPPVTLVAGSFHIMVYCGFLMFFFVLQILTKTVRKKYDFSPFFLRVLMFTIPLPYIANTVGWIVTEVGRQPWVVYGLMKTDRGLSVNLSAASAQTTIILFSLIYGLLSVVAVSVMVRLSKRGTEMDVHKGGY